ncbi:MAG: site-specific DNA-methyltransferase [Candidatus Omnitrophica bacterium]|nr:site-specific DNA-methyltransferase [Candidatus Omnitrophota bacterium]MBU4467945.1 site-specific DNA-methyltransferase [Candidatus Omnitrophota bacterium]MCG2708598.1 site-specific DNA-methyltransferase [Candidatus Omnitrophota bacterium]
MAQKQKLELTWIGKNNPEYDIANIEPRILEEKPELSYGDSNTENMIIHGDNLLALKALLPEYEGKVKCIYIDPPYNTGNAFEHYDDSVEHSTWLSLMKPRLELFKILLSEDGVIFVQIDDNEQAYLKIICDEVFGRENYLNTIIVKAKAVSGASGGGEDKRLKKNSEFIVMYAKNYNIAKYDFATEKVDLMEYIEEHKRNKIGFYYTRVITDYGNKVEIGKIKDGSGDDITIFEHTAFEFSSISKLMKNENFTMEEVYLKYYKDVFMVTNAQTSILPRVNSFVGKKDALISYQYIPRTGRAKNRLETKLVWNETLVVWLRDTVDKENNKLIKKEKLGTLWSNISWGRIDLEGGIAFKNGKKPENLLCKIIEMTTSVGDIILDSFLGSGTTAAVAHKMGRKYIGIEMGAHAYTHCKVRLDKVIDGTDQGGISKMVDWKGGGGFKFYELAPSFLMIDEFGNPVIDSHYNDTKLIRAMCKLMNYTFSPSPSDYWKHGKGQGNNNIYVTTQMLSVAMVQQIVSHLNVSETLLICPKKYEPGCEKVDARITIKKIPQSILKACQFGKKEYLLPIKERAIEEIDEEEITEAEE